jgi:ADP-heptose:LPS heptosyltransferase
MYRNGLQFVDVETMNFVLNHGALGDVVTSLPAIVHARALYPRGITMRVWCPSWQTEMIEHLLAPYGVYEVRPYESFPHKAADRGPEFGITALNQARNNTHTRNRVHMVDYAFNFLLDAQPEDMLQRSYPTKAPIGPQTIPGRYVVLPVGATSENKLFRASVMRPIITWLLEQNIKPVIVGTKVSHTHAETLDKRMAPLKLIDEAEHIQLDSVIDMREKTTLLELRDLCGRATAVVGVDGGTLHLAGTTDTNIIYAMTTTHPKHRFIARQGDPWHKIRYVVPRDLECAGCQSSWTMMRQDFRFCAYGDNLCTEKLDAQDFIDGLKELGV